MLLVDFFAAAENYLAKMLENLQSQTTKEKRLDILEQHLSEEVRELARLLLQGHIDSRGDGDIGAAVILIDFVTLNHKRKMLRTLRIWRVQCEPYWLF